MPSWPPEFLVVGDLRRQGHDLDVRGRGAIEEDVRRHQAGLVAQLVVVDGQAGIADGPAVAGVNGNVLLVADGADDGIVGGDGVVRGNVHSLALVGHGGGHSLQFRGLESVGLDDDALFLEQRLDGLVLDQGVGFVGAVKHAHLIALDKTQRVVIICACSAKGTASEVPVTLAGISPAKVSS